MLTLASPGIFVLGYTQALRPGVKASFGVALDTQKLNEVSAAGTGVSAHKVGTSLVFEAVRPFPLAPIRPLQRANPIVLLSKRLIIEGINIKVERG